MANPNAADRSRGALSSTVRAIAATFARGDGPRTRFCSPLDRLS